MSHFQDLNNIDDIRTAYEKLCVEEDEINERLNGLLQRRGDISKQISKLQKMASNLHYLKGDGAQLASMTDFTAALADNVSAKVRHLDMLKNRVSDCQRRIEDLLDLQFCTEGVKAALQNEDYEKAAAHIHRFLSLDESTLRYSSVEGDGYSLEDAFKMLKEAEFQLRQLVYEQFDEAMKNKDGASIERFFKIFPLLNLHEDGIKKFSAYLCSKLKEAGEKSLKDALRLGPSDSRSSVKFADALTLIYEGVARTIEIHQPLVENYYGHGWLFLMVKILQEECDHQTVLVVEEFHKNRHFVSTMAQVESCLRGHTYSSRQEKLDPRDLDTLLGEVTIMNARTELYLRFIRKRVMGDIEKQCTDDGKQEADLRALESLLKSCVVSCTLQELLGRYITLEQYYMSESVKKAVAMDATDPSGSVLTSSMVDDVFFILKKCVRRALSSCSVDGFCAVVNNACMVVEESYCSALRSELSSGFPSGYLDLSQAYNVVIQGKFNAPDMETAKSNFLRALNNAGVSIEYIQTLRESVEGEITNHVGTPSTKDRAKIDNCLNSLSGLGNGQFRAIIDFGMEQLKNSAIKPRIKPWVDAFLDTSHDINEDEYSAYEANDPFIHQFIVHLDSLLGTFKESLTPSNYDRLISLLTLEVATQLEKVVLKSSFNRLGGLQLDKEVRALISYLSSVTTWSVRDKFARLFQISTLLNVERLSEVHDIYGSGSPSSSKPSSTWRLSSNDVRHILNRRVDFRGEEIKKLRL